jgi:hypothetical protein
MVSLVQSISIRQDFDPDILEDFEASGWKA